MKLFKRYTAFLLCTAAVCLLWAGCKRGFLDRSPQGSYTTDTYPYPKGAGPYDQYVFACYDVMRSYDVTVMPFVSATSIRSDDADKGSTPSDDGGNIQMDNLTLTPSNGLCNALWLGHFSLINRANIVLDQIKKDPDPNTSQDAKVQAEAEARFFRGYGYFMLVRLFGRVPLIDSVSSVPVSQANVPQSPPAAIYALIESDLQFAAANLPLNWDPRFIGRASKGAANGLLAKVYITQQKWAQAMTAAQQVIESGQYDLSTPYATIFGEDGENSKESIFEVQATATLNEKRSNGSQHASIQGVRGSGIWNLGWGFNSPSPELDAAYETGDPRRVRTILYAGGTSVWGEAVPAGLPNPRYNHKTLSNPAMRNKILDNFSYWMNVRLLRYADVVLLYAEAANETGNTPEALAKLELVRKRARGTDNSILPQITETDKDLLREIIRHERRVEMGMEYDRFFDLVRWGIAGPVLQAAGKNFVVGKHELLPIPQTQIDISNGVLTQNSGY
ncbi:RagB/SusD family nutrient uptake outer membrane protein [Chitinophaga alhagiae]|uniref:RagB/SusD family nutrient uptake outer membrane protein n=1 Tax=Chitinophaga alhagiae TaxID=2203219 RepID=UPI000E5B2657|nr:RagB/SusD family nutrient uptake outer membrane protein [Chitinophaga alhagiae]